MMCFSKFSFSYFLRSATLRPAKHNIPMKDVFSNRITMFKTARDFLHLPVQKAVWFQINPLIFTTKVADIVVAIGALHDYCQTHGIDITGAAVDKAREEADVENAGHKLCRPLTRWFRDHDDETNAAKCDLRISDWRGLRDQTLIEKAREIRDLAIPVAATPEGFQYGITSSLVQDLTDQVNEYEEIVNLPALNIGQRKALTLGLRAEFNKVEAKFEALDDFILAFDTTPAGRTLIAGFRQARIIRDAGHGPGEPPAPPAPTPPPA